MTANIRRHLWVLVAATPPLLFCADNGRAAGVTAG